MKKVMWTFDVNYLEQKYVQLLAVLWLFFMMVAS